MKVRLSYFVLPLCAGALITVLGCSSKNVQVPVAHNAIPDNSYMDLKPGGTLRIVVPLPKSGGFVAAVAAQQISGNTISFSITDMIGYETSHYAITGKRPSKIRLKFEGAEISRNGTAARVSNPPALPFKLPQQPEYIRLLYLVRISSADHNMAIIGSKHLDALGTFTKQLKQNPGVCHTDSAIFCSWVPAGIAVRPEAH